MICSQGVLTLRGGMTSHAAVVAKGMGKPCVAGCEDLNIDLNANIAYSGETIYNWMSITLQNVLKKFNHKRNLRCVYC